VYTKILIIILLSIIAIAGLYIVLKYMFPTSPKIEVNVSSISVKGCVGSRVTKTIVLSNTGGKDTSITISLKDINGIVSPRKFIIYAGKSTTVNIEIRIEKEGTFNGKIIIEYESKRIEIPIQVTGIISQKCLMDFYNYNKNIPLNAKETVILNKKNYTLYKVTYQSVNNKQVTALFIRPKTGTSFSCIFFIPGLSGKKEVYLDLMTFLCSKGYSCFSIDLLMFGERKEKRQFILEKDIIKVIIQTVFDVRRGLDYLKSRGDIDSVALYGRSLGGIIGSIVLGVENRFKAGILVITGGNITYILHHTAIILDPNKIEMILKNPLFPYTEPLNYISYFDGPIQFHFGEKDDVIPLEAGLQLASHAKNKEVYTYNAGHGIPMQDMIDKILNFLNKYL